MPDLLNVLLLALLPAGGNFAGGLVAEWLPGSEKMRSMALHAAAGVVVAVVAIEIMPEAVGVVPGWGIALAFLAGGLLYMLVEFLVERSSRESGTGRMWMIYAAVATDLFSDGLMIGAGTSVAAELGLTLAVGQVLADIPEGAAVIMTFRDNDVPRGKRLALSASFLLPVVAGGPCLVSAAAAEKRDDSAVRPRRHCRPICRRCLRGHDQGGSRDW